LTASSGVDSPRISVESPVCEGAPKVRWSRGRRRSPSTSSTRFPLWAIVMPIETEHVDLPSRGPHEATSRTLNGRSGEEKSRLVRIARAHSEIDDLGLALT